MRGWESSLIARKVYAGSYPVEKGLGNVMRSVQEVMGRDNFIGSGEQWRGFQRGGSTGEVD